MKKSAPSNRLDHLRWTAYPLPFAYGGEPNLFELSDGALLAEALRLLQKVLVGDGVVSEFVRDLPSTDKGIEELRPCLHHEDSEDRAPRVTDEHDLLLLQGLAQLLCQFYAILSHAIDRYGRRQRRTVLPQRSASAALIPLHDGEVLQPRAKYRVPPRIRRIAGASVQKQQDWILSVFAADRDPLLDAADLEVSGFIDAVWTGDGVVLRVPIAHGLHHRAQLLEICVDRWWL